MSRAAYRHRSPAVMPVMAVLLMALSGCQREDAAAERLPIMVRTETVAIADYAPRTSLTGVIAARTLNNLSFRVGGRVAERLVDVGQHVDKDAVLARIDPQEQESDLRSAQADLDAAQAQLTQATAAFERQKTLLAQGFTTRRDYDAAEQALKVAQGSVDAAQSALANAQENLSFTELKAGAAGVVTARQVEAGQVVQAAQTVFTVAEDGDRDAVFNVQETLVARAPAAPRGDDHAVVRPAGQGDGQGARNLAGGRSGFGLDPGQGRHSRHARRHAARRGRHRLGQRQAGEGRDPALAGADLQRRQAGGLGRRPVRPRR